MVEVEEAEQTDLNPTEELLDAIWRFAGELRPDVLNADGSLSDVHPAKRCVSFAEEIIKKCATQSPSDSESKSGAPVYVHIFEGEHLSGSQGNSTVELAFAASNQPEMLWDTIAARFLELASSVLTSQQMQTVVEENGKPIVVYAVPTMCYTECHGVIICEVPATQKLGPKGISVLKALSQSFAQITQYREQQFRSMMVNEALTALDVAARGSSDNVTRRVCELMMEVVPCEKIFLWIADEREELLTLKSMDDETPSTSTAKMDTSTPAGYCAVNKKALNVSHLSKDARFKRLPNSVEGNARATLCLPVTDTDNHLVAVLQLVDKLSPKKIKEKLKAESLKEQTQSAPIGKASASFARKSLAAKSQPLDRSSVIVGPGGNIASGDAAVPFAKMDEDHALALSGSVAIAIRLSGLLTTLRQRNRTATALRLMLEGLYMAKSVPQLVTQIRSKVKDVLMCDRVTFYFVDTMGDELWSTPSEDTPFGIRLKIGQGIAGNVAETKQTYRQNDVQADTTHNKESDQSNEYVTRSILTVALECSRTHRVLGVLQALNKDTSDDGVPGRFSLEDVEIMESLANELSVHLLRLEMETMAEKAVLDLKKGMEGTDEGEISQLESMLGEYHQYQLQRSDQLPSETLTNRRKKYTCANAEHGVGSVSLDLTRIMKGPPCPEPSSWEIPYFEMTEMQAGGLLAKGLNRFGLFDRYGMKSKSLLAFMEEAWKNYHNNEFHNFQHGLSTFHIGFLLLDEAGLNKYLRDIEVLSILIGGIGHDLDHPGTNNAFQIQSQSELAVLYNDISVLESHHAATLFKILAEAKEEQKGDIIEGLTQQERKEFRHVTLKAILATDMQHHGEHVQKARNFELGEDVNDSPPEERLAVVECIVHSADIGAQAMPVPVAQDWSLRVCAEFSSQAKTEAELGLVVTPFMTGLDDTKVRGKSQVGFVEYVMAPLWRNFSESLFPECKTFMTNLGENKHIFAEMAKGNLIEWKPVSKTAIEEESPTKEDAEPRRSEIGAELSEEK